MRNFGSSSFLQSNFGSENLVSLDELSSEETDQKNEAPNSPLGRWLERHTSLGAIIEDVADAQSTVSSK